jgi:hypothetical protein
MQISFFNKNDYSLINYFYIFDINQDIATLDDFRKYFKIKKLERHSNQKGGSKKSKSIRKHRGIYQSGPKAGKLRPGFKYTGERTKTGLKVITEIKK